MLQIHICTVKKYVLHRMLQRLVNSDCSKPCPVTCVEGHCYPGNGSCVWGCNTDNCLNDICDATTGKCTQGCKIRRRGDCCDNRRFTNIY